jgi:predicted RNA-binding protein YlxR (DUF448 family)
VITACGYIDVRKREPERTCVGCGRKDEKRRLLRFSVSAGGVLTLDLRQRAPGRGIYLCPQRDCFRRAVKKRRLLERLPRAMVPDWSDWVARVEAHLKEAIDQAGTAGVGSSCANEPGMMNTDARGPATCVAQALQSYISLSSKGVVRNDQD